MCRPCSNGWGSDAMTAYSGIAFSPLLHWGFIAGLGAALVLICILGAWRGARGTALRFVTLGLALLALANPSLVEEQREALTDVAVVVMDDSPSQAIGERAKRAAEAEAVLRRRLGDLPNLEVRVVQAGGIGRADATEDGTRLFGVLDRALGDVPRDRVAGAILVTDGQVHDAPAAEAAERLGFPVHVLLTGDKGEIDRRLIVEKAPAYGIVGEELKLEVRVEDGGTGSRAVTLSVRVDLGPPRTIQAQTGTVVAIPFRLERAGNTVIEVEAAAGENELTLRNNRIAVSVNGVRDRLRVLLITGEPHTGERIWRNFLKADPAVDLVHFTILRPPEKQDGTPIRELSLIAFPIRELFEIKLSDFNLVIFDQYRRRGVLPNAYYENIANYVRKGGALFEAAGPAFSGPLSIYRTPLADVFPARPTGSMALAGFKPTLSEVGRRHPVTADLTGAGDAAGLPSWGRWFRQVEVETTAGNVLMHGYGDQPLLLLDRVGQGRVAQFLSDHLWLWARGFEGGGPHQELLRRVAHWLMKEPELEENVLKAEVEGDQVRITRRSLEPTSGPAGVTAPDGTTSSTELLDAPGGRRIGTFRATEPGLHRITQGDRETTAIVGAINPLEFGDVRTTEAVLAEPVAAARGAIRWLVDGVPDLRLVPAERDPSGRGWLGLIGRDNYLVTGVAQYPLLPALLLLALLLGGFVFAWRRESR